MSEKFYSSPNKRDRDFFVSSVKFLYSSAVLINSKFKDWDAVVTTAVELDNSLNPLSNSSKLF